MSDPADLSPNHPDPLTDPFSSGADALRVEGLGSANGSTAASIPAGANGAASVNGRGALAPESAVDASPAASLAAGPEASKVIDLREAGTTRVRVAKDNNPFNALSKQERMRLIVRVLCEIVAYGELEEDDMDAADEKIDAEPVVQPAAVADLPISNN